MRLKFKWLPFILILSLFSFYYADSAVAQEPIPTDTAGATTVRTSTSPGPPIKWTAKLPSLGYQAQGGNVVPAVIIRDGIVYVPGDNTLTALDVRTGKELWTFDPSFGLSLIDVEVGDGIIILVFASTGDLVPTGGVPQASVIAVDARTGRERWNYEAHESWISAGVAGEDTVYLAASSGSIYSLKVATGEVQWIMHLPDGDYVADIAGSEGILYLLVSRPDQLQRDVYSIYAVDAQSKEIRWSLEAPGIDDVGIGFPSLTLADNLIYATGVHSLYVLEEATGKLRWKYTPGTYEQGDSQTYPAIHTAPVVIGNMVYLGVALGNGTQPDCYGSLESYALGLDAATGQERWRVRTENDIDMGESLAVDSGTLYYTSSAVCGFTYTLYSNLYAVDISSHSPIWQMHAGAESYFVPPLVVTEGTLFTGTVRTSTDVNYDIFYALSTAPVGMPKAGGSAISLWLIGLVGILSIVSGATLFGIDKLYAHECVRNQVS